MASYDASSDQITVLGGRVISVPRAEQLVRSLESAIETAHEYHDSPALHDIGLNEMALNHLLSPADEDYVLKVGLSYDEDEYDTSDLAMEYFSDVLKHSEDYGHLDALINAPDIKAFFDESEGITGFHVEIPDSEDLN